MIFYITLLSLTALTHAQPANHESDSREQFIDVVRNAWTAAVDSVEAWVEINDRTAAMRQDQARAPERRPTAAIGPVHTARHPALYGGGIVLANSGPISISSEEHDDVWEFAAPFESRDEIRSTSDKPAQSDEATVVEEFAFESDRSDESVATVPPPGTKASPDQATSDADNGGFADFGVDFRPTMRPAASAKTPVTTRSATPSTIKTTETPIVELSAMRRQDEIKAPESPGLSSSLRQGIQIARMTMKDQPSELIRVNVDASVVVDLNCDVDGVNIVDPNVADVIVPAKNRVIVVGKSMGTTQLVLTVGAEHRVFHVYVEPNLFVLSNLIRSLAPRSDVRVTSLNGRLVLQGTVSDATTARQMEELAAAYQPTPVINHLSVSGTQQTMLRVVVAEVNKEALRNLGFNWAIGASDWSRDFFFANNVGQLNPTTFSSSGLANVLAGQQLYSVAPVGNGTQTNITFGFPKAELQIFMNALRQNGLARTLAEPNLVAISGQTATFLAGGEVPIPVSQGGAVAGAITIEYKEFGVRLAFTPTVGADQIIRLHVMTEVSDAVPGSRQIDTIPVFTFRTRRVESTIECPNGKTFAIAGLLNETVNAIATKIPGLGDVPILGQLFSSVDYQRSNTELVVLVTPHLVEALEPNQVGPVPGQLMEHPDDFELFGMGLLEGRSSASRESVSQVKSRESDGGTVVRAASTPARPVALHGVYGIEDREPGALHD